MKVCDVPLYIKGIRKARCARKEGHKGMHEQPLIDGTILKWENK